jgi:hypothetical protein
LGVAVTRTTSIDGSSCPTIRPANGSIARRWIAIGKKQRAAASCHPSKRSSGAIDAVSNTSDMGATVPRPLLSKELFAQGQDTHAARTLRSGVGSLHGGERA